jgi:hypothetical protein
VLGFPTVRGHLSAFVTSFGLAVTAPRKYHGGFDCERVDVDKVGVPKVVGGRKAASAHVAALGLIRADTGQSGSNLPTVGATA